MEPIQRRYHFEKQVLSTANGILHEGKDLSLQRQVFLYQIRVNSQTTKDETKRLLGSVSHFANSTFFHMLDLGEHQDGVYIVLEYRSGIPLLHQLNLQPLPLTFPEVLNMVMDLGEALQDALAERVRGFSVTAENLWLDQNQLMVVNYWAEGERHQRGVLGLIHLLYQLLLQTPDLPADADFLEKELSLSIEPYFPEKTKAFSNLIRRVLKGHESLSSFLLELQALKQDETMIQNRGTVPITPIPEVEIPAKESRLRPLTKGLAITSGLLLLFILGYMSYAHIRSAPSSPVSVPSDTQKPVNVNDTLASPPPIEIEATPLPSSEEIMQVPDLRGLSKEEAEKLVLSYGLHYKYYVEYNDQQEGFVFKQEPESGTEVTRGGYLSFWISKGSVPQ